ncbi:hypothetical protein [Streptacidiphilus anmyonensis]|uniref:hypothetical protein n=1 Tax=Streptacidiphilus anmyonensis TaxID=405782 RepID=UPI0005AB6B8A|nr:hypothetical protein [Streptacidiphilus anmyonensis]
MTVQLPLVVVLGLIVWLLIKFIRLRLWIVAVVLLFGFYLAHTMFAPAINSTTKTGVDVVNQHH